MTYKRTKEVLIMNPQDNRVFTFYSPMQDSDIEMRVARGWTILSETPLPKPDGTTSEVYLIEPLSGDTYVFYLPAELNDVTLFKSQGWTEAKAESEG